MDELSDHGDEWRNSTAAADKNQGIVAATRESS